jgi:hypothetical protein
MKCGLLCAADSLRVPHRLKPHTQDDDGGSTMIPIIVVTRTGHIVTFRHHARTPIGEIVNVMARNVIDDTDKTEKRWALWAYETWRNIVFAKLPGDAAHFVLN